MLQASGAGDINAAMNGGNPGGAGEGIDDASGAQDRKSSDDPEARIPGFSANASPPGIEISMSAPPPNSATTAVII